MRKTNKRSKFQRFAIKQQDVLMDFFLETNRKKHFTCLCFIVVVYAFYLQLQVQELLRHYSGIEFRMSIFPDVSKYIESRRILCTINI